jgi:hypothetical protein
MGKFTYWLGVSCGLLAGIIAIVGAIVTRQGAYAAWGVTFIATTITAVLSGARIRPVFSADPPTVGAIFSAIPVVGWIVMASLFAASVVLSILFPPFR